MERLYCYSTDVREIPDTMTQLIGLYCGNSFVTSISDKFTNLEELMTVINAGFTNFSFET